MKTITNEDLAQIYDALGKPEQAGLFRYLDRPDPDALTVDGLSQSIWECLDDAPAVSTKAKHDDECWKKHTSCMAERVKALLP